MTDSNPADSNSNEISDISSQLSEIKENYEKINEFQSEFSERKGLMMAIMNEQNENRPSTSTHSLTKQPRMGLDIRLLEINEISTLIVAEHV